MSLHPNTLKIKKETGKATTVSVLMSVYSEPLDWVKQSIESILTQTFTDFEFIIINDNPQNPKLAFFLNQQSKKEPRIKLHTNPTNIGLTKSLNIGLKLCRGKYIVRMDADDVSLPERLVQQVKFMERNPNIIASSALAYEWDGDNVVGKVYRPTTPQSIKEYIFTSSPFIHPLLIIRRDILEKYSIKYDESFRVSQDYKLAADLIEIGTIANIDDYLLKYRISPTQISKVKGGEQVENAKLIRRKLINDFYKKHNISSLSEIITLDTVCKNYCASNSCTSDINFQTEMNCIRRVLYYSLSKYTLKSLFKFILSGDYLHRPYNIRRFAIIMLKHFKQSIIPAMV